MAACHQPLGAGWRDCARSAVPLEHAECVSNIPGGMFEAIVMPAWLCVNRTNARALTGMIHRAAGWASAALTAEATDCIAGGVR